MAFHEGRWMELLRDSTVAAETHNQSVGGAVRIMIMARRVERAMTRVGRRTGGPWNDVHFESSERSRKATSSAKGTSEPRGGSPL